MAKIDLLVPASIVLIIISGHSGVCHERRVRFSIRDGLVKQCDTTPQGG